MESARSRRRKSKERGLRSESVVKDVLKEMKSKGEIKRFFRANRKELNKFRGIDFVLFTSSGLKIFLQVKSSFTGVESHYRKFPKVPAVIADAGNLRATRRRVLAVVTFFQNQSEGERTLGDWFKVCYRTPGKYFVLGEKPVRRNGASARASWKARNGFQNGRLLKYG